MLRPLCILTHRRYHNLLKSLNSFQANLLASENAKLRDLLKLTPEAAVSYVTARVIASSGGAFLRDLSVDAGNKVGVVRGQAAVTGMAWLAGSTKLELGRRAFS
jgi:rod shape-determining protein MreC